MTMRSLAVASTVSCPFNTLAYAAGLLHVGEAHPSGGLVILRRNIPGTHLQDAISPWPYLWIGDADQIRALRDDCPDLVTLTVLCQPGYVPPLEMGDSVLLKQHFIYDPSLPPPPLSRRAQARLEACARHAVFEAVTDPAGQLEICNLYTALKARRGLNGLFDMGTAHFQAVAGLKESRFFHVRSGDRIGAMACGVAFADRLQVLHTVSSADGLTWNASYLLMSGLQAVARQEGVQLLIGGMPDAGRPGLKVFKSRWVNRSEPVHMIRMVQDPSAYARLCAGVTGAGTYFPAYRGPA